MPLSAVQGYRGEMVSCHPWKRGGKEGESALLLLIRITKKRKKSHRTRHQRLFEAKEIDAAAGTEGKITTESPR